MAVESNGKGLMRRLVGVGYEGRTIEEVVDALQAARVDVLVDVRLNAVSRKPGFSKRRLSNRLEAASIRYLHEPDLGNPKDNRAALRSGDPAARHRYADRLSNGSRAAVDRLVALTESATVGLLCFERDAGSCHRSIVAETVASRDPNVIVIEL